MGPRSLRNSLQRLLEAQLSFILKPGDRRAWLLFWSVKTQRR
jgi:hypothetical protein